MKKGIVKKIACAAMAAMMLFAVGCGSSSSSSDSKSGTSSSTGGDDNSLKKVQDAGKLVLGLDATFKPMGYTDENDKIVGFDIDLAEEVCKRMGVKLETYNVNWDTKEQDLNAGTIDCIWNGLSVSDERKKQMLMSEPYMNNSMVFMVKKDSGVKSKDDLKGKKIAVQNGSTAQEILKDSDIGKESTMTELATNAEGMQQLDLKMVDAVFLDSVVANYEITSTGKDYEVLADGLSEEQYAVGFKLGANELCKKVEDTLKEMKKDGKIEEISKKWFGSDVTTIK
ncbi:MAG: amino acid ABC transporter substrate-binding protein [Ruminococcus sp.]|nr:amino acid ABC transporter substrate-binding protein [Ruminococcus sp.]MBR7008783.1 amino acid ABC transporter substrate-binding protein [Ruminococcus sp.]